MDEVTIDFDPEDLTATELYWLRDYAGSADFSDIRSLVGIVYLLRKRNEPELEVSAVENMKLRDLLASLGKADAKTS
jgi:hypothetical protein